jgi:hypothetical protein
LKTRVFSLAPNPQPGGPGPCIYVPQWQGGSVIPQGTGFPLHRLLGLAGLRWRYPDRPLHGVFLRLISLQCMIISYNIRIVLPSSFVFIQ